MFKLQKMNRILMAITVSLLLLGSISITNAWELTVRNPTDKNCKVKVWDDRAFAIHPREEVTISPGGSYTWNTGGYCPSCMIGEIWDGQVYRYIKWTNCLGGEISSADGCSPCCWNTSWRICRKRGEGAIHDYDYGFCKD